MANILKPAELRAAAPVIRRAAQALEEAAKSANAAANALISRPEGQAGQAFMDEKNKLDTLSARMAETARDFADQLERAADIFDSADGPVTREPKKE